MTQSITITSSSNRLQCLICHKEYAIAHGLKYCPQDQSLLCPIAEDQLLNTVFDEKYEIQEFIGAGGFGRVYKGRHIHLEKAVAIKVLTTSLLDNAMPTPSSILSLKRFSSEAKATNQLIHPNIVGTLDHGTTPQPYIVMEYIEGETLEDKIKRGDVLSLDEFLKLFEQVCQAMSLAHESGCLHRDLKPSNIMIDSETGLAKILDFGLVKLVGGEDSSKTGEVVGSPPYMSPEQCRGAELDERSDIYSLGCVMYESLTAIKPFEDKTAVDCMYRNFHTTLLPISSLRKGFPEALDYVVAKSLADLSQRYESIEQLRSDLAKAGCGTLTGRLPKINRPTYRKTVKDLAGISAIGNWTIVIFYLFLLLTSH